jgi:hypothetical protein
VSTLVPFHAITRVCRTPDRSTSPPATLFSTAAPLWNFIEQWLCCTCRPTHRLGRCGQPILTPGTRKPTPSRAAENLGWILCATPHQQPHALPCVLQLP